MAAHEPAGPRTATLAAGRAERRARRAGRLPARVRAAVAATDPGGPCCRRAELATWIALRGRLHQPVTARALGAPAAIVVMEAPSPVAAERAVRAGPRHGGGLQRGLVGRPAPPTDSLRNGSPRVDRSRIDGSGSGGAILGGGDVDGDRAAGPVGVDPGGDADC